MLFRSTVNAGHNGNVTFSNIYYSNALLVNDSDAEGDAFTMTAVNGQALVDGVAIVDGDNGGVFTVNADGMVQLDASTGFEYLLVGETATTSFTYTVTDTNGASSTATTTITVNGQNDAVTANADALVATENDADINLNVLANDTAFDGNKAVSAVAGLDTNLGQAVAGNNGGAFTINADGTSSFAQGNDFDYLKEGQTVTTEVSYTVTGYEGENSTSTVSVTVTGVNDAPNAVDNAYTVNAGHNGNVTFSNIYYSNALLVNDSDAEGDAFTMTAVNGQALVDGVAIVDGDNGGVFTVNADGMVQLDASTGFEYLLVGETATTSFTYTVTDTNGASSTATTTITVNGQNDAVTANADALVATENDADINLNVLANDTAFDGNKAVSAVAGLDTNLGQAVAGNNGGAFTINADGTSSFAQGNDFDYLKEGQTVTTEVSYTVTGYEGENSTSTVSVTVTGVNDAPNAVDNAYTVNAGHNGNVTFSNIYYSNALLVNDSDAEGDAFTMTAVNGQALVDGVAIVDGDNGGVFTVNADGMVQLDASTGFEYLLVGETATTSFTYTVTDANGASSTATTTITVNGQNEAPIAADDVFATGLSNAAGLSGNVLLNDTDPDGDALFVASVNGQALTDGSVLVQGDNDGWFTVYEDGTVDFDSSTGFESLAAGETVNTSVEYTVTDDAGNSDLAAITVTVENDYTA